MREILLTQGKVALVDDEDHELLKISKWYANKNRHTYYAMRGSLTQTGLKTILMHTVIMNPPKGMEIDHINGNGLDNRKENLMVVTCRQNAQNRHMSKHSQYPGVSWDTHANKWRSYITVKGKQRHLGYFIDELEAAKTYCVACTVLENI
jgi:predicted RNA methylase